MLTMDISVEIVKRLKARDRSGITLLYEHYSPALFKILLERLGTKEIAQEALQDVFLKMWSNIDQYDENKGPGFVAQVANVDDTFPKPQRDFIRAPSGLGTASTLRSFIETIGRPVDLLAAFHNVIECYRGDGGILRAHSRQ